MATTKNHSQDELDSFLTFLSIDSDHPEIEEISMSDSGPKIVLAEPLDLEKLERATERLNHEIREYADKHLVELEEYTNTDQEVRLLYKTEYIDGTINRQKIGPTFRKSDKIVLGVKSPVLPSGEPVDEETRYVLSILEHYFHSFKKDNR